MAEIGAILAAYDACLGREDLSGAENVLNEALRQALETDDRETALYVYNERMGFLRQYGDVEKSVADARSAEALLTQLGLAFSKQAAYVWLNAATVYKNAGYPEEARTRYENAERCFARFYPAGDAAFAGLYNNMAALYLDDGDFPRAAFYYERAASILRRTGGEADLAVTMFNLALLENRRDPLSGEAQRYASEGEAILDAVKPEDRGSYYHYTCRKLAGAAAELGLLLTEQTLRERADRYYAGR